jgi:hypothetical protein
LVTFLFWNLNGQPLTRRIARLAAEHQVDVIMLAECEIEPAVILAVLNAGGGRPYCLPPSESRKIRVVTRFTERQLVELYTDPVSRLTVRRVELENGHTFLLAIVHLPSKVNWDREDQMMFASTLARDICEIEDEQAHQRTVLVGDLNMNPFDPGVTGAHALHGVMTRAIAGRIDRAVQGRRWRLFYNPMWGCFGDRTPGPPGTYYLRSAKPINYFWNLYDQVLIRPALMHALDDLRILDSDGEGSLLSRQGLPRDFDGSDHLPILFGLNL